MSRRRGRSDRAEHEHLLVRHVYLRCPVNPAHPLGTVRDDVAGPKVWPAFDRRQEISPYVPLRLDGSRLRWTCPMCRRGGLREDRQLRWSRVLDLLAAMREHGPPTVRVAATPQAVTAARPEASRRRDTPGAQRDRTQRNNGCVW